MDHTALVLYYTRSQNTARVAKAAEGRYCEMRMAGVVYVTG